MLPYPPLLLITRLDTYREFTIAEEIPEVEEVQPTETEQEKPVMEQPKVEEPPKIAELKFTKPLQPAFALRLSEQRKEAQRNGKGVKLLRQKMYIICPSLEQARHEKGYELDLHHPRKFKFAVSTSYAAASMLRYLPTR